ncbi:MAG: metallophosphoesterase [Sandaracinus sp.]
MRFSSRLSCALVLLLAGCPSPTPAPEDAGSDGGGLSDALPEDAAVVENDADVHMGLRLPRCEDTDPAPASALPHFASTLVGSYVPHAARLGTPGSLNPATEMGETMYRGMGLHVVDPGAGQTHVTRTDLGASSTSTDRRSLLWMAHLSDFQLADDESPVRLARLDNAAIPGGMRAQEAYLPRAVSAMNRTFTRISDAGRPFDVGIITGDCGDSALQNELDWVLQLMNGTPGLETDSGEDDDPIPGPDNDPKDPFDPTPFPAPWLYVPGNHDLEVVGITTPTAGSRMDALGTRARSGTRDYRQWYAPVTTGTVPADPHRVLLDRDMIVDRVTSADVEGPMGPLGHGYDAGHAIDTTLGANYAYDVIPGLVRILGIDTSDPSGGSEGMVMQATIDGWLEPELDRAVADGVLVILASHHSTRSIDPFPGQVGSTPMPGALTTEEIEAYVASRPEVIAWLVGHTHDNQIHAIEGVDAAHPGYWEIMTSAIADWPSQARTIEVVDNGDGTLSIFATLIDYDTDDCFERRYRALTQMEYLSAWADEVTHDAPNHNVELVRAIPASAMAAVTAARATAPTRIESLTTLADL